MRRSAFFIRFIGIGVLFHLYVSVRLISDAPGGMPWKVLAALLLVASVVLIPIGMSARNIEGQPLADRLAWLGLTAIVFFVAAAHLRARCDAAHRASRQLVARHAGRFARTGRQ